MSYYLRLKLLGVILGIVLVVSVGIIVWIRKTYSGAVESPIAQTEASPISEFTTEVLSESTASAEPATTPTDSSKLGVLLLGYGGAGHEGGFLTDAIQVLYIDFTKSQINLISIPRDLWVSAGGKEMKINATLLSASKDKSINMGAQAFKQVISEITGLSISYFLGVDFVGFQRAIGINLKGIDIEVKETLDDPWYPIPGEQQNPCDKSPEEITEISQKYSGFELEKQFPCRYKHLLFKTGMVHMEGGDALEYVRSRHGSSEGDVSRGKRQQEVLTAIKSKLFKLDALDKLPGFFNEIVKHTTTDIDINVLKFFLPALEVSRDYKVNTINLSPSNVLKSSVSSSGAYIMIPKAGVNNWGDVRKFILGQIAGD